MLNALLETHHRPLIWGDSWDYNGSSSCFYFCTEWSYGDISLIDPLNLWQDFPSTLVSKSPWKLDQARKLLRGNKNQNNTWGKFIIRILRLRTGQLNPHHGFTSHLSHESPLELATTPHLRYRLLVSWASLYSVSSLFTGVHALLNPIIAVSPRPLCDQDMNWAHFSLPSSLTAPKLLGCTWISRKASVKDKWTS